MTLIEAWRWCRYLDEVANRGAGAPRPRPEDEDR